MVVAGCKMLFKEDLSYLTVRTCLSQQANHFLVATSGDNLTYEFALDEGCILHKLKTREACSIVPSCSSERT